VISLFDFDVIFRLAIFRDIYSIKKKRHAGRAIDEREAGSR
jgi:hypothetical protein